MTDKQMEYYLRQCNENAFIKVQEEQLEKRIATFMVIHKAMCQSKEIIEKQLQLLPLHSKDYEEFHQQLIQLQSKIVEIERKIKSCVVQKETYQKRR